MSIQIRRFFKEENGNWYADLPDYIQSGGTKEDCQMVLGADTWLDIISEGQSEIVLSISKDEFEGTEFLKLDSTDLKYPEYGAYYRIGSFKGINYSHERLWLCPVTLFVFGEYPNKIYYRRRVGRVGRSHQS